MHALPLPLALALLAPLAPQQQQQEPAAGFEERVEVIEVLVDVLVTDRKGNVVQGLGPGDFQVKEAGRPVAVTGVSFYTTRYEVEKALAETTGEALPEGATRVPASRYFILLFEDQTRNHTPENRLLQQQRQAGHQAHDWVRDGMGPSDWVAVARYDAALFIHQDFTQDQGSLMAAIADATLGKNPDFPTQREHRRIQASTLPSLLRVLPHPADVARGTPRIYDAVRLLAEATGGIVGRKNLLLFTIGFGQFDRTMPFSRPDQRYYPAMQRALNDNNVAVYPVSLWPPGLLQGQESFLSQLASDTGGVYFDNLVNFSIPLERVAQENTGYYLLSYRTEVPAGEPGYREIEVKVDKPKTRVRARRGYYYGPGAGEDPRGGQR